MRTRTQTVKVGWIDTTTGWSDASLTVIDTTSGERRRNRILLRSPYDLRAIRKRLEEIEAAWRKELG